MVCSSYNDIVMIVVWLAMCYQGMWCFIMWSVFYHAVRLGAMLGFAQMDEESVTLLLSHVHDFLRYSNSLLNKLFHLTFCIL